MQIIPFPAHYQSVYTNFDISSFSLISCDATVALLQARLGPFRPVFAPQYVSAKFKRLIIRTLKMLQKSLICTRVIVRCKYRKQRSRK